MSLEGKTILIVEDEPMLRELIGLDFKENGARVLEASTVDEALDQLRIETVSLIISDIRLPGKDGVQLLKLIKDEALSNAPVILVTGFADYTKKALCEQGATDVLYKPFDIVYLVERSRAILSALVEPSEA